jgi:hypothetical protein
MTPFEVGDLLQRGERIYLVLEVNPQSYYIHDITENKKYSVPFYMLNTMAYKKVG